MEVIELKSKIKSNTIPNFLIFAGTEWVVQNVYIEQIAKVKKSEIRRVDSIVDIYHALKNKSFITKSCVYVVRDDKELMQNEKLWAQLDTLIANNTLILLLTTLDKRLKLYKTYKSIIVEFETLTDAILKRYIDKEINLSDKWSQVLIDSCEHDYGRILLEIDKIKRYAHSVAINKNDINWDYYIRKLVDDGTIYQPPYDAIFDLVNSILDRKVNRTFNLLEQSYAVGEATLVMLSVLYNNVKAVLQVQTCESSNISKSTGLTIWQIQNARKYLNRYSNSELIRFLRLIQKCESGIKKGTIEDSVVMQYLLIKVL